MAKHGLRAADQLGGKVPDTHPATLPIKREDEGLKAAGGWGRQVLER